MSVESQIEVIGEAGYDKGRHKLVRIRCLRCSKESVTRASNAKRNKSCGCLQRDTYHKFRFEQKKSREKQPFAEKGPAYFEPFCNKGLTPMEICFEASKQGLYVPEVKWRTP